MRGKTRGALLTAVLVLVAGLDTTQPAFAAQPPPTPGPEWFADLSGGEPNGVAFTEGALRLTAPTTGLLTVEPRTLAVPVGRVDIALDARLPPGASADVDIRARLPSGNWSEWQPSRPGTPTTLAAPSDLVQPRVLLSSVTPGQGPSVRGLRVHTEIVPGMRVAAPGEPASYRVHATREGLVSKPTANGHKIGVNDLFVALPSRRVLAAKNGSEYSVRVCAASGACAWAPVWDVGPWNVDDDYWGAPRRRWPDLPRGVPQAQAAFKDDHNDGEDGSGRDVANPAGIDLADGLFRRALKLKGTAEVTVTYLWTGQRPLSTVDAEADDEAEDDYATVRGAPDPDAEEVGQAGDRAGVAVECDSGNGWLRIGADAFVAAEAVTLAESIGPC